MICLFTESIYTGNNLPDSPSMNEWPSAAGARKARDLNKKGPQGHPLLHYCRFIAVFLCGCLSQQTHRR